MVSFWFDLIRGAVSGELSVNAEFGKPSELSAAKSVFITIGAGTSTVSSLGVSSC